jgi:hypothetical protein
MIFISNSSIHDSPPPPDMSKVVSIICMMLCLSSMAGIISPVSAQILPEVILECDDEIEINLGEDTVGRIDCVAENPSSYQEKIDIEAWEYSREYVFWSDSFTIEAGESVNFEVIIGWLDKEAKPAEYVVNITATISQVAGAPYPQVQEITEEVIVVIIEYSSCEIDMSGFGGYWTGSDEKFVSGDEISIWAVIDCWSNVEVEVSYQIHLFEKNMGSSSWPSGFQNIDDVCSVEIDIGKTTTKDDCDFKIGTPTDLEKVWEGCIVIIEKGDVRPNICPEYPVGLVLKVEILQEERGLGIEFGGNESVLEQLGITEEQVPVIAGSIGILILIIGGFVYYRKKGQEYEYE